MSQKPDELIPTRRSLLCRLKDCGDRESWQEFFDTYWKLIYGVAIKTGLTDAEAQDVVQETIIAVARNIPQFEYDATGSFKAWLLNTTRWKITDQFRKRLPVREKLRRTGTRAAATTTIERIPNPENCDWDAMWDSEWENHLQATVLERVRTKVNPKHYQIFDLYVMKNWPVEKVAATFHISQDLVYQTKSRILKSLQEEAAHLQKHIV